jgi:hypothetical protein
VDGGRQMEGALPTGGHGRRAVGGSGRRSVSSWDLEAITARWTCLGSLSGGRREGLRGRK